MYYQEGKNNSKIVGQKGIAVYIAIIIMTIILGVGLGITDIIIKQIKITSTIGDSVQAFYAADMGIEKVLFYDSRIIGGHQGLCWLPSTNLGCRPQEGWPSGLPLCKTLALGLACDPFTRPFCADCACCISNYYMGENQYYHVDITINEKIAGARLKATFTSVGTYRPSDISRAIYVTIQY